MNTVDGSNQRGQKGQGFLIKCSYRVCIEAILVQLNGPLAYYTKYSGYTPKLISKFKPN